MSNLGFNPEQPIRVFNNKLQFNSLYRKMIELENNFLNSGNDNWDNFPDHFIEGSAVRSAINEDIEVQIGNSIYKYYEDGTYVIVTNADLETLKGIDNGTLVIEENPNVSVFDPNEPEPLEGTWCKSNRSNTGHKSSGSYRMRWKIGTRLYPYIICEAYATTSIYQWKFSWGKYKWVSIKHSACSRVWGWTCDGGNFDSGNVCESKKSVTAKYKKGCQTKTGEVRGYHAGKGFSHYSILTF